MHDAFDVRAHPLDALDGELADRHPAPLAVLGRVHADEGGPAVAQRLQARGGEREGRVGAVGGQPGVGEQLAGGLVLGHHPRLPAVVEGHRPQRVRLVAQPGVGGG